MRLDFARSLVWDMRRLTKKLTALAMVAALTIFPAAKLLAGDPDSPAAPDDAGSAMYTLEDIYNRLDSGTTGSKRGDAFVDPAAGPTAGTGKTLDEIMGKAPVVDDVDGAVVDDVLSGKKFWGLRTGAWGLLTGTMANVGRQDITPGTSAQTITQGYHDGTGSVAGDADLVSTNIRAGVNIFGVVGDSNVVNTSSGDAVAGDIRTGKKVWVDGQEIVGTLDPDAIPCSGTRWSNTAEDAAGRWCDNGDGTVTDLFGATINGKVKGKGLVWLKNAGWGGQRQWRVDNDVDVYDDAHTRAGLLKSGDAGSELTDGSVLGDWRLPTLQELKALSSGTHSISFSSQRPFSGIGENQLYWSSTTSSAEQKDRAESLHSRFGIGWAPKTSMFNVWPVRAR